MIFASMWARDSYYSDRISKSSNCVDCSSNPESSFCYEVVDGAENFDCQYSQNIFNCSGCIRCLDCTNCHDCIGCSNLINVSYHIDNIPYSREDFLLKKESIQLSEQYKKNIGKDGVKKAVHII